MRQRFGSDQKAGDRVSMTAASSMRPARFSDADEVLHAVPDTPLWVENYLSQAYFPAAGVGMFLHMGRMSFDVDAWDELVLIYLPGDMFLTARGFGYGGETERGTSGPGLTYECLEPWRRWRKTFHGPARLISGEQLRAGAVTDGLHSKASFDLTYEAMCPVFELGDMTEQNWASKHYEQHCMVTGTLAYGGTQIALQGSGIRDHSTGTRDLTGLQNHIWCHAEWPDGRAFCLMYISNQDGTGRMNHVAFCDSSSVRYGRLVSEPPLLTSWTHRSDNYSLVFDVEGEMIELVAKTTEIGAFSLAGPGEMVLGASREDGCHHLLSEAMTQFSWSGTVGYGLTERSVRLS
jgi:hypothetical protein